MDTNISDDIEEIFFNNENDDDNINDNISETSLSPLIETLVLQDDEITEITLQDDDLLIPEIILNAVFTSIDNNIEDEKIQEIFNIGGTEIPISSKNVKLFNINNNFINKDVYYLKEYIEILKKHTLNDIIELINELPSIMINEGVSYNIIPSNYKRIAKIKLKNDTINNSELINIYNNDLKHTLNKCNLPERSYMDEQLFRHILYLMRNGELPIINKQIINALNTLNIEYYICNNNNSLIYEPIKYDTMKTIHKNLNTYLEGIPIQSIFNTVFFPTSKNEFDLTKLSQKSKYYQYLSDINLIIDSPNYLPFDKLFKSIRLIINNDVITRYSSCIRNYLIINNKNDNILNPIKTIIEHEGIKIEIYRYIIPLHFFQETGINLSNKCKIILDNDNNANCYLSCTLSIKNDKITKPILFDDMIYTCINNSKMSLKNNKYYYNILLPKDIYIRYLYFNLNTDDGFISMNIKHNNNLLSNVDSTIIKYHQYKYFNSSSINLYSFCEKPLQLSTLGGILSNDISIEFCLNNDIDYLCICLFVNKIIAC